MGITYYTKRAADGRKIVLLDLVWTLAFRSKDAKAGQGINYGHVIKNHEQYRLRLIERLVREDFYVCMVTARSTRHQKVTIESIRTKTDWVPDAAVFNELEIDPPKAKKHALDSYIYPEWGRRRGRYFALESNRSTTAMYESEGIVASTWEKWLNVRHGESAQLDLQLPSMAAPTATPSRRRRVVKSVAEPELATSKFVF